MGRWMKLLRNNQALIPLCSHLAKTGSQATSELPVSIWQTACGNCMMDSTRPGATASAAERAMPSDKFRGTPMLHLENLKKQAKQIVRWAADLSLSCLDAQRRGNEPQLLGAHPQLFVSDVEASCCFFVTKLGFTVRFKYRTPVFYALVQRDSACLNLRYVHTAVLNRKADRDLLSASIPVGNVKALYLEYQSVAAPMHQRLKSSLGELRTLSFGIRTEI